MTAGDGGWPLWATLRRTESAGVTWSRNPFDRLLLETGEDSGETPRRALLATGQSADSALRFRPGLGASSPEGRPFEISLTDPRFAVACDAAGEQTALFARYGPEPAWLHGDGLSLLLGDGPETPPFELVTGPGQPAQIVSTPALLQVHAPLEGALAEFGPPPTGTTFDIAPLVPAAGADGAAAGQNRGAPLRVSPPLRLIPFNFTVSVLRPQDLLALRFEFINMSLEPKNGTGARMVRSDAAKPAYMIVHFPPQNVAERAYFETQDPEEATLRP